LRDRIRRGAAGRAPTGASLADGDVEQDVQEKMKLQIVTVAVLLGVTLPCTQGEAVVARELGDKSWWGRVPTKPKTNAPVARPTEGASEGLDKQGNLWYRPRVCGGRGFDGNGNGFGSGFDKQGFFKCVCANLWNRTGAIFKSQKAVCDWCDSNKADSNYLLNGRNRRLSEVDQDGLHPTFAQNVNRFGRALDSWDQKGWPWWLPMFGTNYLSLSCGCCRFWTAPPTAAPTTAVPVAAPTSAPPTTEAPTTEAPTTEAPTTEAPTTEAPTTEAPTTEAPTTESPTESPTTPTTAAPTNSPTTPTVAVNIKLPGGKRPGKGKGL
jgi:hypothetical protein